MLSQTSERSSTRPRSRPQPTLTRIFVDPDGVEWEVVEIDGSRVPAAKADKCLVFRSPNVIRRVWNYPRDWQDLAIRDLITLSWSR